MTKQLAISLAAKGKAVCPLEVGEKFPPAGHHGYREATKDSSEIERLWSNHRFNVGIATGAISGVWVLDVDAKPPVDKDGRPCGMSGFEALIRLGLGLRDFNTLVVRTPGRGWHVYWTWPDTWSDDRRIGPRKLVLKRDGMRLLPVPDRKGVPTGLDTRGERGQIVAPGCVLSDGRRYEVEQRLEVAAAPRWIVEMCLPPLEEPALPPVLWSGTSDPWGLAILETHRAAICGGYLHDDLLKRCFAVGGLVGGGYVSEGEALAALLSAEKSGRRKSGRDESRTVRHGISEGARRPAKKETR
jgi:hypothetical protein